MLFCEYQIGISYIFPIFCFNLDYFLFLKITLKDAVLISYLFIFISHFFINLIPQDFVLRNKFNACYNNSKIMAITGTQLSFQLKTLKTSVSVPKLENICGSITRVTRSHPLTEVSYRPSGVSTVWEKIQIVTKST